MVTRILAILCVTMMAAGLAAAQNGPADPLWELYRQGEFEQVILQGKALINTGQGTAQVDLAVGRALTDSERYEEAIVFLQGAVDGDPEHTWVYAWGQVYLGACHYRLGDPERARQAWITARNVAATRNATRNAVGNLNAFGLAEHFDAWREFKTEHFRFLFSDRLVDFDPAAYAREHEAAYAEISSWFGGGPAEPILFVVWADQEEATAAGMPQLGFAKPELNLVHCVVQQTVGHEMTHVISWAALEPGPRNGLINEGTAVAFDQTGRDRLAVARRALAEARTEAGEPLPPVALRALWEDASLAPSEVLYPVAGAWVERLIARGGQEKFKEFFRDQRFEHARAVYGEDLGGWIDEFEEELRL